MEKKMGLTIFDICLIVFIISIIIYIIFSMLYPLYIKDKTSGKVEKTYEQVIKLEESVKMYYNAIIDENYRSINDMTPILLKKSDEFYKQILTSSPIKNKDFSVMVFRAEIIGKDVYRCKIKITGNDLDNKSKKEYIGVISLNQNNSTFKIIDFVEI